MVELLCSSFWSKALSHLSAAAMPLCSNQEALLRLFYNASSSFLLLFLFLFSSSFLLLRFFNFIGNYPLLHRDQQYEYVFSDDEDEEEEEGEGEARYCYDAGNNSQRDHLMADIVGGGQGLMFLHCDHRGRQSLRTTTRQSFSEDLFISPRESSLPDEDSSELENHYASDQTLSVHRSPLVSDFEYEEPVEEEQQQQEEREEQVVAAAVKDHQADDDSVLNSVPIESDWVDSDKTCEEDHVTDRLIKNKKVQEANFTGDDRFFVLAPTNLKTKRLVVEEKDEEEIYGDSCTVGSTSKSSSDWRSSVICRDSGTEDPFSSSSRRSCPKWESYTVFQKYDEEMTFLDRISAQKLHETESLKSIHVSPRSISERIAYKFSNINKTPAHIRQNPYRELEAAYVAQICLTWEALNWNYHNFQSKKALCLNIEAGCPATVAQQFQQFQVLLQRYVENEPYEHGRRPEIYARMRLLAPKLLLVPEYRDSEDDQGEDDYESRISSTSFLMIMEDGIRTFMNFLKADKEKPCQILAAYFKRNRRSSVDPALLRLMKKVNQKKKTKVKDLRRSRKCLRKRKQKEDQEMEILMALIDLKVVSRVLRMNDLSEEQLQWCEEKMSKVRVMDGKLQRDSTPLFFPAH
ncbi:uncharacterized protein LOC114755436 [Neltuma alba]|uniref:uncharacterized protein LOC114755436 n=1 Tax=Neltuma alba TaxID=207710 RepID=UPI0010A4F226|nr:uncharacterized protein LOC114755436 [Prosopis alba]